MEKAVPDISVIVEEFQKRKKTSIIEAENYLFDNETAVKSTRRALEDQMKELSPSVFQWLYNCARATRESKKFLYFVVQFIPDLIYLYLHCNAENLRELKASTEALLLGIIKESERDKPPPIQVPLLSRPSIYHQTTSTVSPLSLTEAALNRHNQTEIPRSRPVFSSSEVNVANRLLFLTNVSMACTDNMTTFSDSSQTVFCQTCTKLAVRGMPNQFLSQLKDCSSTDDCVSMDDLIALSKEKRFTVNDDLFISLLQGVRLCLCQPCHFAAKQALQALKSRAEYELLPLAVQISSTLERFSSEMHPLRLPFDPESHKTYSSRDKTHWPSRPTTVLRTFTGQVLQHHLFPSSSTVLQDQLYDPSEDRLSCDAEHYISESFAEYGNQSLQPPTMREREAVSTDRSENESLDSGELLDTSHMDNEENAEVEESDISPAQVVITISSPQSSTSPLNENDALEIMPSLQTKNTDDLHVTSSSFKMTAL